MKRNGGAREICAYVSCQTWCWRKFKGRFKHGRCSDKPRVYDGLVRPCRWDRIGVGSFLAAVIAQLNGRDRRHRRRGRVRPSDTHFHTKGFRADEGRKWTARKSGTPRSESVWYGTRTHTQPARACTRVRERGREEGPRILGIELGMGG